VTTQSSAGLPAFSPRVSRRRVFVAGALVALVCCSATSCSTKEIALSSAGIAAAVVGTTVGVTLAVQHSRHTLEGCILTGGDGLELRLSNAKVYALKGVLADVKVGERLKVHGSKVKRVNGDTAASQTFLVEKVNKDFGPCSAGAVDSSH
jgi:hypothetical protein